MKLSTKDGKLVYSMDRGKIEKMLSLPLEEILAIAGRVRREGVGKALETCGIINAKSGTCGEDCKFCAQSGHYATSVEEYPLKSIEEIAQAARRSKEEGSKRFGIVTSGKGLTDTEIKIIADAIRRMTGEIDIIPCASLGALNRESFTLLKEAGLVRYHHNIETSERFYPNIVSTHDYSERISTIKDAKSCDLEVCSGGIFGLGESWRDRIDMACLLKELDVDSVPLNFLVPIEGTPLGGVRQLSPVEAIKIIALFRIVLPDKTIRVAAGRESVLKDFQGMMYAAGANGMMVGGYLTVAGRGVEEDLALVEEIRALWNEE